MFLEVNCLLRDKADTVTYFTEGLNKYAFIFSQINIYALSVFPTYCLEYSKVITNRISESQALSGVK